MPDLLQRFLGSRQQGSDARVEAGSAPRLRARTLFPRLADMLARLTRPLLLALLLILPLQSMAAALAPVLCMPQEHHHTAASLHSNVHGAASQAYDHATPGHDHGDSHVGANDGHSDKDGGHVCCHHFASATPMFRTLAVPHDFRAYAASVALMTPLHIPELPQRPPRG